MVTGAPFPGLRSMDRFSWEDAELKKATAIEEQKEKEREQMVRRTAAREERRSTSRTPNSLSPDSVLLRIAGAF